MTLEKTQLKLAKSRRTGELIGFVSRHSKTQKLMGVREDSRFGKKICLLSEELKGRLKPNKLYSVALKLMHNGSGYVIISAEELRFLAHIDCIITPKTQYQVTVIFGNKTVFFDPKDGKGPSSRTMKGVLGILNERDDIENKELVINDFTIRAKQLLLRMAADGCDYDEPQE